MLDARAATGEVTAASGVTPVRERRVLVVLALSSFLAFLNFGALAPFFPRIARDVDTSIPLLGQVATVMLLLSTLLGLAIGPLADRFGHRRLMTAGIVAVAVNLAGTGLAPSYSFLLVLTVAGALGDAVLFGLPLAIAGVLFAGSARRRAIAWVSAALPAGGVAGVPLLSLAGSVTSWRVVFVSAGIATLATTLLALAWLPSDAQLRGPGDGAHGSLRVSQLLAAYRPLLRHRPLLALYAAIVLRAISWSGMSIYLGAFLDEQLDFGQSAIGLTYMASAAVLFMGNIVVGRSRLFGRLPLRQAVAGAMLLHGLLLGLLFLLPDQSLAVLAMLTAGSFIAAVSYVGLMTLTMAEARGGVATTMVLAGSVLNFGVAVSSALGGLLLATGGYRALGLGLPACAVLASAILILWDE